MEKDSIVGLKCRMVLIRHFTDLSIFPINQLKCPLERLNTPSPYSQVAKHLMHAYSLGIVLKKNELLKICGGQRKNWNVIRQRAATLIKHVFGFVLKEVPNDKDNLIFIVEPEVIGNSDHIDEDLRMQKIFLFIVLGFLTLKGPPVTEGQIMDFLRKLGIDSGETCFGSVNDLLTTKLTSQYYLKRIKEDNAGTGEVW